MILDEEDEDDEHPSIFTAATAAERIGAVIALAEKYFDRFDTVAFLELLPRDVSVASLLHYFQTVLEYGNAKKRNLQVTADTQQCSRIAFTDDHLAVFIDCASSVASPGSSIAD